MGLVSARPSTASVVWSTNLPDLDGSGFILHVIMDQLCQALLHRVTWLLGIVSRSACMQLYLALELQMLLDNLQQSQCFGPAEQYLG